jgi:hypothetical protein
MPDDRYSEDAPRKPRRPRDDDDFDDYDDAPRPRRRRSDEDDDYDDGGISTMIPYKNSKALTAYYCGVFSLIPCVGLILGPLALIFGLQGLKYAKKNPRAKGTGHAIAGIVLGGLVTVGHLIGLLFVIGAAIFSK